MLLPSPQGANDSVLAPLRLGVFALNFVRVVGVVHSSFHRMRRGDYAAAFAAAMVLTMRRDGLGAKIIAVIKPFHVLKDTVQRPINFAWRRSIND